MKGIIRFIGIIFGVIVILGIIIGFSDNNRDDYSKFENTNLKSNLASALESINMDASRISTIERISDWNNGTRYKINYDGNILIVYANDKEEISSIRRNSNGEYIYGKESSSTNNTTKEAEIVITEGELGKYGKYVTLDGKQYIRYYVPAGTYEVKALRKNAMLFIVSKEIKKNSSGYDEATTDDTVELSNVGDTKTITITENECISLVINSSFSLIKK